MSLYTYLGIGMILAIWTTGENNKATTNIATRIGTIFWAVASLAAWPIFGPVFLLAMLLT